MPETSDRPLGAPLPDWTPRPRPGRETLRGPRCLLEPLSAAAHAEYLWRTNSEDDGSMWDYMSCGPFAGFQEYRTWVVGAEASDDPLFFAIVDGATGRASGVASYLRIDPVNGVVEVGNIAYSPALQGSIPATEAMHLMMAHAFDGLGYRRYEWKCNAFNAPSRRAAQRLGFSYEGLFRNHMVVKGRSRDTAWFAITDRDWPAIKAAHQVWLAPENFDAEGRQRQRLSALTKPLRTEDPGTV
ncbi:MAG: GNAT family N-acetyltransferase [Rhodospirillales bacterium CG15_BIG_FIL_POST_REV_8_21_14_020_66_15]|nr:MAG: GNAT family N-acetyltransferase [Rhodospirillales bacterium CG15_BIG_FIL_POST_REV_8_21_14_020_66_15]